MEHHRPPSAASSSSSSAYTSASNPETSQQDNGAYVREGEDRPPPQVAEEVSSAEESGSTSSNASSGSSSGTSSGSSSGSAALEELRQAEERARRARIRALYYGDLLYYLRGKATTTRAEAFEAHQDVTQAHPVYPTDSFHRFRPFDHLKNQLFTALPFIGSPNPEGPHFNTSTVYRITPAQYVYLRGQPLDRPNRVLDRDDYLQALGPSLEVLDFTYEALEEIPGALWFQALAFQQQLRYIKVADVLPHFWPFLERLGMHPEYRFSLRHLHSLMILYMCTDATLTKLDLLVRVPRMLNMMQNGMRTVMTMYADQLKHLHLHYLDPWDEEHVKPEKLPKLPRLRSLNLAIFTEEELALAEQFLFVKTLESVAVQIDNALPLLFEVLFKLPELKKFSLMTNYDEEGAPELLRKIEVNLKKLREKYKPAELKIKVLSLESNDLSFFVRLFEALSGHYVVKLQLKMYNTLDFYFQGFTSLHTLRLDYGNVDGVENLFVPGYIYSKHVRKLTIAKVAPVTVKMLKDVAGAFPALTELNVSAQKEADYEGFQDQEFATVLEGNFPKLTIFRFTDNFTKPPLDGSIGKMHNRALMTNQPVIFCVPLDDATKRALSIKLPSRYFSLF